MYLDIQTVRDLIKEKMEDHGLWTYADDQPDRVEIHIWDTDTEPRIKVTVEVEE